MQNTNAKPHRQLVCVVICIVICCVAFTGSGCSLPFHSRGLPSDDRLELDQLIVHADFKLPSRHRLLEEMTALRGDIAERLRLTPSNEPINVYLFEDRERFETYMAEHHPDFPHRRAFFVKDDTTLSVYAYWGEKVAEDLRHEVTHGYLHSTLQNLPLWLDEGLAEYHEVPRGRHGFNWNHIELLIKQHRTGQWQPDLERLEALIYPDEMTQMDYAESWLWTHYMLETEPFRVEYLRAYIGQLAENAEAESLSTTVMRFEQSPAADLIVHLEKLHSLQK